nr:immunoglobulin heavy chain junction region [Mus musculus]
CARFLWSWFAYW